MIDPATKKGTFPLTTNGLQIELSELGIIRASSTLAGP